MGTKRASPLARHRRSLRTREQEFLRTFSSLSHSAPEKQKRRAAAKRRTRSARLQRAADGVHTSTWTSEGMTNPKASSGKTQLPADDPAWAGAALYSRWGALRAAEIRFRPDADAGRGALVAPGRRHQPRPARAAPNGPCVPCRRRSRDAIEGSPRRVPPGRCGARSHRGRPTERAGRARGASGRLASDRHAGHLRRRRASDHRPRVPDARAARSAHRGRDRSGLDHPAPGLRRARRLGADQPRSRRGAVSPGDHRRPGRPQGRQHALRIRQGAALQRGRARDHDLGLRPARRPVGAARRHRARAPGLSTSRRPASRRPRRTMPPRASPCLPMPAT